MDAPGMMSIEVPEYAFTIEPDDEGNPWYIGMQVTTSATMYKTFLCLPQQIEATHRVFNRELTRLGVEIKRHGKRLVAVSGVNSDGLRSEKGRK